MDLWRDVGRDGDVLRALGFHGLTTEARDLAQKLVDQAENEVGEQQLVRREYYPSKQARERAYGFDREELRGETRGTRPREVSVPADLENRRHYGVFNIYVNVGKLKSMWIDAAIAMGVTLATGGSALPGVLTVIARAVASLRVLSEDEAELVHVIIALANGHAYSRPVPEDELRAAYRDATVSLDDLVEALVERGFAKRRGDGVQLVF